PERLKDARFDSSPEGRYLLNEWAEALEGFFAHIPRPRWMNHPAANAQASHKLEQLTTAQSLGLFCSRRTLSIAYVLEFSTSRQEKLDVEANAFYA
ncbi:hypothetical protein SMA90_25505, partial [Escherichia coli]